MFNATVSAEDPSSLSLSVTHFTAATKASVFEVAAVQNIPDLPSDIAAEHSKVVSLFSPPPSPERLPDYLKEPSLVNIIEYDQVLKQKCGMKSPELTAPSDPLYQAGLNDGKLSVVKNLSHSAIFSEDITKLPARDVMTTFSQRQALASRFPIMESMRSNNITARNARISITTEKSKHSVADPKLTTTVEPAIGGLKRARKTISAGKTTLAIQGKNDDKGFLSDTDNQLTSSTLDPLSSSQSSSQLMALQGTSISESDNALVLSSTNKPATAAAERSRCSEYHSLTSILDVLSNDDINIMNSIRSSECKFGLNYHDLTRNEKKYIKKSDFIEMIGKLKDLFLVNSTLDCENIKLTNKGKRVLNNIEISRRDFAASHAASSLSVCHPSDGSVAFDDLWHNARDKAKSENLARNKRLQELAREKSKKT